LEPEPTPATWQIGPVEPKKNGLLKKAGIVPSLKLTASLHLKMDGWKTILSSIFRDYVNVRFREGRCCILGGPSSHDV